MSSRTVSRHFATKEEIVVGGLNEVGQEVVERLAERPAEESPWQALRSALEVQVEAFDADDGRILAIATMLDATPALRSAVAMKHEQWQRDLVPLLMARLPGPRERTRLEAGTIVATTLACLTVAADEWRRRSGRTPIGTLLDAALATARGIER